MMPVRILSPTLELLGQIDDYESLQFVRRWHRPGEFELHINRHKQNTDVLQKGNLVLLNASLGKVGIIRHKEINLDQEGKGGETVRISGPSLSGVTQTRITIPPDLSAYDTVNAEAETVLKHYVDNNIVNPTDADRKIDIVSTATDQARGDTIRWQSRYKKLHEELEEISKATGLGWNIYLDFAEMEWVFEVYEGVDRTSGQSVNPPVIFSPEFDAIEILEFMDSDIDFRNVGYTAGQGEGADREVLEVGTSSGLDRREVFFDARDVEETLDLQSRGEQRLSDHEQDKYLSGRILEESPFIYKEDYDLGDMVTVQNKDWGVTLDTRITEITEIYEPAGFRIDAVFGNKAPTFIDKVKDEFKDVEKEVRR